VWLVLLALPVRVDSVDLLARMESTAYRVMLVLADLQVHQVVPALPVYPALRVCLAIKETREKEDSTDSRENVDLRDRRAPLEFLAHPDYPEIKEYPLWALKDLMVSPDATAYQV